MRPHAPTPPRNSSPQILHSPPQLHPPQTLAITQQHPLPPHPPIPAPTLPPTITPTAITATINPNPSIQQPQPHHLQHQPITLSITCWHRYIQYTGWVV
jgi:hypothetical protein